MILISHLIIPTRPTTLSTVQNIIDSKDNQRTMKLAKECKSINCSRRWICIDNGKASSPNTNRRSAERDGDKKRNAKKKKKIRLIFILFSTTNNSPLSAHRSQATNSGTGERFYLMSSIGNPPDRRGESVNRSPDGLGSVKRQSDKYQSTGRILQTLYLLSLHP